MVTRFCVTSVPRSAGDDAITLGGVSSYHPPSGAPMRAQEERRKKTTPPLNPLPREGKRLRIDSITPPLNPLPGEGVNMGLTMCYNPGYDIIVSQIHSLSSPWGGREGVVINF